MYRTAIRTGCVAVVAVLLASNVVADESKLTIVSTAVGATSMGYGALPRNVQSQFFEKPVAETLVRWNDKGLPTPWLATGWTIAEDLSAITFTLQEGVKFQDGTRFDAKAVKYNLDKLKESERPAMSNASSVDVVDDYTVRVNFNEFNNGFLHQMAGAEGVMASPAAIEKYGDEIGQHPVGTGPFRLAHWEPDALIRYEKHEGYWREGEPYVDVIEIQIIEDPITAVLTFKSGEADVITNVPLSEVAGLDESGQYNLMRVPWAPFGIVWDSADPESPFSKLKVRQAASHAIDWNAIMKAITFGYDVAINQGAPPEAYAYNPDVVGYPYDPEKARQLLADAGYPDGFKTTLTFSTKEPIKSIYTAMQAYFADVGIDVDLDIVSPTAYWTKDTETGWEGMMHQGYGASGDWAVGLLNNCTPKGQQFVDLWFPEDASQLIYDALATPDEEEKIRLVREFQRLMVDEYAFLAWGFMGYHFGFSQTNVEGTGIFDVFQVQWTPESAKVLAK